MDNVDAFSDTSNEAIDEAMQVALSHNVSGDPARAQLEALALVQTHVVAQARAQSEDQVRSQEMFINAIKQAMQESHANIECQILASSQYQKHTSDTVEARFRASLEQFRVVSATEAKHHIATKNQLVARIDRLDGARAQYEMMTNE